MFDNKIISLEVPFSSVIPKYHSLFISLKILLHITP